MTALVWPFCTTEVTDGLCVFPYLCVYQRVKCSSTMPKARANCTAHIYLTLLHTSRFASKAAFWIQKWFNTSA